jgi:serine phosphatase RsbU (regulator of sigma subunit)
MIQDVRLEDVGLQLESGDALVMFTDGIIPKQESSGEEPEGLLRDLRGRVWRSAAEIRDRVLGFVDGLGPALHDDIAVLIVRAR